TLENAIFGVSGANSGIFAPKEPFHSRPPRHSGESRNQVSFHLREKRRWILAFARMTNFVFGAEFG
ncbi:MAG: hypothetical protein ACR2QC_00180, partial [Gammaproteobacteria bacterium]